ncbi:MAG TPA: M23 family metallopeptidase, partial [Candidatus Limnocylindria bacterium]
MATIATIASVLIAMPSSALAAPPEDKATAPQPPDFLAPWACGEAWYGSSYPDHGNGDRALDFNEADNAEAGQPALAAAPGVVHLADSEFFEPSDERVHDGRLRMADETRLGIGEGANVSLWRFNGQLYIDHGNGWYSFYAHLDPSLPSVADGAQVETGDVLGYVDNIPNPLMATGVHLHYEQKLDANEPYSVYEAKTQRMQFQGMPVADPGARGSVQVVSLNCEGDPDAAALALQAMGGGFSDDLLIAGAVTSNRMRFWRYLVDSEQVMGSRDRMHVHAGQVGDRVLTGDFTNDGVDDVAVVVQQRDGSFQLRVWSEGRDKVGPFYDPAGRYSLDLNEGRLAVGDFDGDGFTDDIVMAKAKGAEEMRLIRYLFDGPDGVTVSRRTVPLRAASIADRMLVGDFTNDGTDDVAFVIQQADRSFQVKVWDGATVAAGIFFDPRFRASLAANQGRLISGDFDADGYTDDIAMAMRLGPNHLGLRRYLLDGANQVTIDRETIRIQAGRSEDQLLRGDF